MRWAFASRGQLVYRLVWVERTDLAARHATFIDACTRLACDSATASGVTELQYAVVTASQRDAMHRMAPGFPRDSEPVCPGQHGIIAGIACTNACASNGAVVMQAAVVAEREVDGDYVQRFLPLVKRLAGQLMARLPASVEADDMVQAGLIGLMDAVNRFEEGQGVRFEAYAAQRIRGAMLDELRAGDWLPRSLRRNQREIERTVSALEQSLKRVPFAREIADALQLSVPEYHELLNETSSYQLVYFEDFAGPDELPHEALLEQHCPDDHDNPMHLLHDRHFREALVDAVNSLPDRERRLMHMYYEGQQNFREIAVTLGVTESRVCQLRTQAITRLRGKMKDW